MTVFAITIRFQSLKNYCNAVDGIFYGAIKLGSAGDLQQG